MPETSGSRVKRAWNVFMNRDPTPYRVNYGVGYSSRPDRMRFTRGNERTIVTSVYNRIALDVAAVNIQHVRLDENGRFLEVIPSGLNSCLNLRANLDQTGRAFIQDVVMSMLDEGCVAIVPVDTIGDPYQTESYDIQTMRTAKILEWYPEHILVEIYNDRTGRKQELLASPVFIAKGAEKWYN